MAAAVGVAVVGCASNGPPPENHADAPPTSSVASKPLWAEQLPVQRGRALFGVGHARFAAVMTRQSAIDSADLDAARDLVRQIRRPLRAAVADLLADTDTGGRPALVDQALNGMLESFTQLCIRQKIPVRRAFVVDADHENTAVYSLVYLPAEMAADALLRGLREAILDSGYAQRFRADLTAADLLEAIGAAQTDHFGPLDRPIPAPAAEFDEIVLTSIAD